MNLLVLESKISQRINAIQLKLVIGAGVTAVTHVANRIVLESYTLAFCDHSVCDSDRKSGHPHLHR